jgi:Astacin (Peptidase family M12A)
MKKLMLLSASALLFVACQNPSPSTQAEYSPISFEVSGSQLPAVTSSAGSVIAAGDIVLGDADQPTATQQAAERYFGTDTNLEAEGHGAPSSTRLWANSTIPYVIAPSLAAKFIPQVTEAVNTYASRGNIRLVPRTNQRYYVQIVGATNPSFCGLASSIGFTSTRTGSSSDRAKYGISSSATHYIVMNNTEAACANTARTMIHEFGHILGLRHEQSRPDRDQFIRIDVSALNNDPLYVGAYSYKYGTDGRRNAYDYNSVMHYNAIFRKTGLQAIFPLNPSTYPVDQIGGSTLSNGDVQMINTLYPTAPR